MSFFKRKKSFFNSCFDRIVCINLCDRIEKKEYMNSQFKRLNIDCEFYSAVPLGFSYKIGESITSTKKGYFNYKKQPNEVGCSLSHYYNIKKAYMEGINKLFIFEDDCIFINNFDEIFKEYYNNIPVNYDAFMLYNYMEESNNNYVSVNNYWKNMNKCWSAISYSLNRRAMEFYIDYMDNYFCIADLPIYKMGDKLNCYVSSKPLIIPKLDFKSDIRDDDKHLNKSIVLKTINFSDYQNK